MGQAQSSNYSDTVINSYAKVLQATTSSALQNSINQINIGVSGGSGDVNISNVQSKQTLENNLVASFKQANDSSIVQKVSQELQQQASSLISGVNFGNYSESNNVMRSAITASMDVSQTISTTCASTAMNTFILEVEDREGNINLDKINVEQTIKNSLQCATESLNKSVASQDVENKIAQKATAESKGLSLDFLVAIILGIIVVCAIIPLVFYKMLSMPAVAIFILFSGVEVAIYLLKLQEINKIIAQIEGVMAKNQKILQSQPKPNDQLRSFNYTCGLYGIGNYTSCFTPLFNTKPPMQNISGCLFEEQKVDTIFTSPDDAYSYWLGKPNLTAIDIISKHNGEYDYHFYSNVSRECIALMDNISKDPTRTTIPELVCGMNDPIDTIVSLSPSSVPGYTFVFSADGFLYYSENDKWVKVNEKSLFAAPSTKNITISIGSPETSSIRVDPSVVGTYYYIDISKAREEAVQKPTTNYYFTIYTYDLGANQRTDTITLDPMGFVKYTTIDITELVLKKKIGPYMTNPKLLTERNCTIIWDTDMEDVQKENQQLLDRYKKEQKAWQYGMIGVGCAGVLFTGVAAMMGGAKKGGGDQNKTTTK